MPKRMRADRAELKPVKVGAAAIDVGSKMHMAAVDPSCVDRPVRAFGTFTQDLHDLADWFKSCGVTSVAMESTWVYWIPVYEILEQHGFEVILVNARYAKNVPGRKTEVSDAAWLRQLHSYGLLRGSFRPDAASLRAYLRQRKRLMEYAAAHIQYMQKALMELHHVVSDITGATGMRIIRAIIAGEHNPDVLATYRDARCHSSIETVRAAHPAINLRRQSALFAHPQIVQSGSRVAAVSRDEHWAQRHGTRSILSTAILPCRQGRGRNRYRPQNCGSVLQYSQPRHGLPRSRCRSL